MAENSLTDFVSLINQQVISQEELLGYLSSAQALTYVALGEDFLNFDKFIINDYLFILNKIIGQARTMCEQSLDIWLKHHLVQ